MELFVWLVDYARCVAAHVGYDGHARGRCCGCRVPAWVGDVYRLRRVAVKAFSIDGGIGELVPDLPPQFVGRDDRIVEQDLSSDFGQS